VIDREDEDAYALPPFADLVAGLADVDIDADLDPARAMDVERVTLALPVELTVVPSDDGGVRVRGSTPTQYTETTVMPAFHRLTLHLTKSDDAEG
jgi:hypothetical protein